MERERDTEGAEIQCTACSYYTFKRNHYVVVSVDIVETLLGRHVTSSVKILLMRCETVVLCNTISAQVSSSCFGFIWS